MPYSACKQSCRVLRRDSGRDENAAMVAIFILWMAALVAIIAYDEIKIYKAKLADKAAATANLDAEEAKAAATRGDER